MSKYGIPYKGSKSKITEEILEALPPGNRLVDLFGGGFAITHCALVNYGMKWNKFLYNDINPLLKPLISDCIAGKYNYNVFKPGFITRDKFKELKESDGYIKWVWSFGNNGNDYLYGKDIEKIKEAGHNLVVFNKSSEILQGLTLESESITDRRLELQRKAENNGRLQHLERVEQIQKLNRMQNLSQLETLQRLEDLQGLETLQRLEVQNLDYREYKYEEGDVVYCDIPYEDSSNRKNDYGGGFNHKEFYEWVHSRPFPVYWSSYSKGSIVWQKEVRSTMNTAKSVVKRNEVLFKA